MPGQPAPQCSRAADSGTGPANGKPRFEQKGNVKSGTVIVIAILILAVLAGVWLMRFARPGEDRPAPSVAAPPAPSATPPEKAPIPPPSERPSREAPTPPAPSTTKRAPSPAETPPIRKPAPDRVPSVRPIAPAPVESLPAAPAIRPREVVEGLEPAARLPGTIGAPTVPPVPPPSKLFAKESTALEQVLDRYEQAYDQLDARAAAAIWPSVDSRALARAFARLRLQDLEFGECTFAVSEHDATAHCTGVLHYARRIGDTAPRTERHMWTINFARAGEVWRIVNITAQ
jgi:hypothetical protein